MSIDALRRLFDRFDRKVAEFAGATRLSCPPGCGECCDHADTEVTEVEAELIASYIESEAPGLRDHLRATVADHDRVACVFYDETNDLHCMIYRVRPLICSAFGYSAYSDKSGNKLFAVCPAMDLARKTGGAMQILFEPFPPVVEHFSDAIERINRDAYNGVRRRPLGAAVAKASGVESRAR